MNEERHPRRPNIRWLLAIGIALAMGAALLAVLRQGPTPTPRPTAGLETAARVVPAVAGPGAPPTAFALPTPVPRAASALVQAQDWLGLAQSFDVDRALAEIERLCQPDLAGRRAGTEGGRRAAEYIAGRFAALGLVPAGDGGTYLQGFSLPLVELAEVPSLTLAAADGRQWSGRLHQDFVPIASGYTGSGLGEGPVIWLNQGSHRDYDGIDASGAIVVCRHPADEDVYRQAAEHRVAGLLIVREDAAALEMGRVARETSWVSQTIPAAYVGPGAIEFLLADGEPTLADLSIQYASVRLAARARLEVAMREVERAQGQNVLGILPGANPARRQEIVVLGAHYDHLGQAPDGTLFAGANDNASGVAALLEIARSWQAAGFIPERTVLFAAWDAEEQGLVGSTRYVRHPVFPLARTVAMLQLDMVGAGDEAVLMIDGDGVVEQQAQVSAAELGVEARLASIGRSDHAPFRSQGVPASMFIWPGLDGGTYHRPGDLPATIDPGYLRRAGTLASLVALHLSATQPQLVAIVEGQGEALQTGDIDAFLASVSEAARLRERERFQAWWQADPQEAQLSLQSLVAAADVATATLRLRFAQGPGGPWREAEYPARFVRELSAWRYGGLATHERAGSKVRLLAAPGAAPETLLPQAEALYDQLHRLLALPEGAAVTLELYPGHQGFRALLGCPGECPDYRLLPGGAALAAPAAITETLVSLALAQAGLPSGRLTWLPAGLAGILQERTPEEIAQATPPTQHARDLAAAHDRLWAPADLPEVTAVAGQEAALWRAQARSLAAYLLQEGGWASVAALARAASAAPTIEAAYSQALGYPPVEFEARWRRAEVDCWLEAGLAIDETLRARSQAVAGLDRAAFLATVNPANPTLWAEQEHWFEDIVARPLASYSETGRLEELGPGRAVVLLSQAVQQAAESRPILLSQRVHLVEREGRWLYNDLAFEAHRSAHFTVRYDPQSRLPEGFPQRFLADAERAWSVVRADWPSTPDQVEIKLYPDPEGFRLSIFPSLPGWAVGWTEPGESIKLNQSRLSDPGYTIAHELAHQALDVLGLRDAWLHEGIALVAQQKYDPCGFAADGLRRRQDIRNALRQEPDLNLLTLATWQEVEEGRARLLYAQAWDLVSYVTRQHGQAALQLAVELRGQGSDLDEAFARATGQSLATLVAGWRESALAGHIPAEAVALAGRFDEAQALETVVRLSGPEFAGRAAGTPEGEAAARFIAERFQALGLEPAGDGGTYLQHFAISASTLVTTPVVSFAHPDGRPIEALRYRQGFREIVQGHAGSGTAEGEVVWIAQSDYAGVQLGGRIAVQRLRGDRAAAVRAAWQAGAGGLILVLDRSEDMQLRSAHLPWLAESAIPVVEMSNETFVALFKKSGRAMAELSTERPVLRLGFTARLSVRLETQPGQRSANVLASLPGRDARLRQEVLIVAAHHDHLGSLPDGTIYPGANNNASGVGVLLEMARLLATSREPPRRTILFAAWGAEELGMAGSRYYVGRPWAPLSATTAMIQLDSVGQGRGYYLNLHGDRTGAGELLAALSLGAEAVDVRASVAAVDLSSGHAPFHERQVPAVLLAWRDAENAYLPADTADLIDPRKLGVAGKAAVAAVCSLAER